MCLVLAAAACGGGGGNESTTTGGGGGGSGMIGDCDFAGTWVTTAGGANCGPVGPFDVTSANLTHVEVSSFGSNASVDFSLKLGTTDIYEADGLTIFNVGAHHCEVNLDCDNANPAIVVQCRNNNGGTCEELLTKAP